MNAKLSSLGRTGGNASPCWRAFPVVLGGFLGLCLLKFGNPPIMEEFVSAPSDIYELLLGYPWPIQWAYALLSVLALGAGVLLAKRRLPRQDLMGARGTSDRDFRLRRVLVSLPLAWWLWQLLAGSQSSAPDLTGPVLVHFGATVVCFYLGYFVLRYEPLGGGFWLPILVCFWLVMVAGWQQHFGGLEQTRRYFYLYIYPQLKEVPPEYLKKMTSTRIFGTLFYPNALAGALLLLLPPLLAWACGLKRWLTPGARGLVAGITVAGALACLAWSGSKGGWLIAMAMLALALLRLPLGRRFKVLFVSVLILVGLVGFFWRYAAFFQRGATSVGARFDYWRAALTVTGEHPFLGSGPGSFGRAYSSIRPPGSEPARLAHNDYLQQASDSGIPGLILFAAFIAGGLFLAYPRRADGAGGDGEAAQPFWGSTNEWQDYAIWLGLLGWSLQGLMEFGLYIPALAWPAFTLFGWKLGALPDRSYRSHCE